MVNFAKVFWISNPFVKSCPGRRTINSDYQILIDDIFVQGRGYKNFESSSADGWVSKYEKEPGLTRLMAGHNHADLFSTSAMAVPVLTLPFYTYINGNRPLVCKKMRFGPLPSGHMDNYNSNSNQGRWQNKMSPHPPSPYLPPFFSWAWLFFVLQFFLFKSNFYRKKANSFQKGEM